VQRREHRDRGAHRIEGNRVGNVGLRSRGDSCGGAAESIFDPPGCSGLLGIRARSSARCPWNLRRDLGPDGEWAQDAGVDAQ
jgi:hypothetical protein